MFDPVEVIKKHLELLRKYDNILKDNEKRNALEDPHSKRGPRPCGITVHVTLGCPFRCTYCYIYDMGFTASPKPYPLNARELAYALLNNRNFVAGRYGTLIAIGSVGEPFIYPQHLQDYLRELTLLGNPIQISTKAYISRQLASVLHRINPKISFLVSIITLRYHELLEPYAPDPYKRLETLKNLSDMGFKPCLFLRPIIPRINESEIENLLIEAKDHGARCVVIGSFRVTYNIYLKLKRLGLDTSYIESYIRPSKMRRRPTKQFTIPLRKKKETIIKLARKHGLIPFKSACCANSFVSGVICPSICFETGYCTYCPNQCWLKPRPDLSRVREAIKILGLKINITEQQGRLYIDKKSYRWLIQVLARRITI